MSFWKRLLKTGTLATALLVGCGDEDIEYVPVKVEPLFANVQGVSDNRRFAALEDERNDSQGDVLSFNIENEQVGTLLQRTDATNYGIIATVGNKVIVEENNKEGPRDIVVCNLETLMKDFDTDSPTRDENVVLLTDDGKAVVGEYNLWTYNDSLLIYDPQTNSLEDLFPSSEEAQFFNKDNSLAMVRDNFGNQEVYGFDKANGGVNFLLSSVGLPYFWYFMQGSNQDVVAYKTDDSVAFHKTEDGTDVTFSAAPDSWQNLLGLTKEQAILAEEDIGTKYFHFDLANKTKQEIDFSALGGWMPKYWDELIVGTDRTLMEGYGNPSLPNILFYNPLTNIVEDLITSSLGPGESLDYCSLGQSHKGKALIDLQVDTGTGWRREVLFFDGVDVTNPFGNFDFMYIEDVSKDGRHAVLDKEDSMGNAELVYFDLETQVQKILAGADYFGDSKISDDGSRYAYTAYDQVNNEWVLNVYDLTTDTKKEGLAKSDNWISLRGFNRDNSAIVYDKNLNTARTFMYDLTTEEEKFICYH